MSFNGSGVFQINSTGQPPTDGTAITVAAHTALTADLATGLSTAVCKDGQTTVTANIPLSGYKLTGVGIGTATTDAATVQNANARSTCEFRLTLTTAVPVTTADVTAAETLYCAPYRGNAIALYDGTNWVRRTSAEFSIDVPDATGMYDVFCYDNAGTPTLELTAWTNDTTRATALTTQDGVLVKTGVLTRRYLGSFYSTVAGNGQIEDSVANRYLWNYYNRVRRPMRVFDTTNTWTYTTATVRQANGSTANQLNFCIGVSEDIVIGELLVSGYNDAVSTQFGAFIGLDSTTAAAAAALSNITSNSAASTKKSMSSSIKTYPGVGKHYYSWLEYSAALGTTTWIGDNGDATGSEKSGIHGEILG